MGGARRRVRGKASSHAPAADFSASCVLPAGSAPSPRHPPSPAPGTSPQDAARPPRGASLLPRPRNFLSNSCRRWAPAGFSSHQSPLLTHKTESRTRVSHLQWTEDSCRSGLPTASVTIAQARGCRKWGQQLGSRKPWERMTTSASGAHATAAGGPALDGGPRWRPQELHFPAAPRSQCGEGTRVAADPHTRTRINSVLQEPLRPDPCHFSQHQPE